MMKNIFEKIRIPSFCKPIIFAFSLIMIGISVYYIPHKQIEENIRNSYPIIQDEGDYPWRYDAGVDNFTDIIILQLARYDENKSKWRLAFENNWMTVRKSYPGRAYNNKNINPAQSFLNDHQKHYKVSYSRYWQGHQLFMRPLLFFTDYGNIRTINSIAQIILLTIVLFYMIKNKLLLLTPIYIAVYILLSPRTIWLNITYSVMYYVYSLAVLFILTKREWIKKNIGYNSFFVMIGILTCYVDFLTYPIVSLAVPMTFIFYLEPTDSFKDMVKKMIMYPLFWGIGYLGMWILKWSLSSIVIENNLFDDAITNALLRISDDVYLTGNKRLEVISLAWEHWFNTNYKKTLFIFMLGYSLLLNMFNIKEHISFVKNKYYQILPFILTSCSGLLYWVIFCEHTYDHKYYSYRTGTAFIFPLIAGFCFWAQNTTLKNFSLDFIKKLNINYGSNKSKKS